MTFTDQANELRQLAGADEGRSPAARARILLILGAKGGVGATTLAIGLAQACAAAGEQCVLIDADPCGADATTLLKFDARWGWADVLAGSASLRRALLRGAGGFWFLPGVPQTDVGRKSGALARTLNEIAEWGAERIVIDGGRAQTPSARQLWTAADDTLLVTTADPIAVTDCYTALKGGPERVGRTWTVVTRAERHSAATCAQRIGRAAWRMLGLQAPAAGHVPAVKTDDTMFEYCRRLLETISAGALRVA